MCHFPQPKALFYQLEPKCPDLVYTICNIFFQNESGPHSHKRDMYCL